MADARVEWVAAEVAAPAESGVLAVEVRGLPLVLCRAGGRLFALENRCPHAFQLLSEGRLRGFVLECPFHGGTLDVRDGSPLSSPIRSSAASYPVRDAGGRIEIGLPEEPCTTS